MGSYVYPVSPVITNFTIMAGCQGEKFHTGKDSVSNFKIETKISPHR